MSKSTVANYEPTVETFIEESRGWLVLKTVDVELGILFVAHFQTELRKHMLEDQVYLQTPIGCMSRSIEIGPLETIAICREHDRLREIMRRLMQLDELIQIKFPTRINMLVGRAFASMSKAQVRK